MDCVWQHHRGAQAVEAGLPAAAGLPAQRTTQRRDCPHIP